MYIETKNCECVSVCLAIIRGSPKETRETNNAKKSLVIYIKCATNHQVRHPLRSIATPFQEQHNYLLRQRRVSSRTALSRYPS